MGISSGLSHIWVLRAKKSNPTIKRVFFPFLNHSYTSGMVKLMSLLTVLYLTAVKGSLLPEKVIVALACQTVLSSFLL